MNYIIFDLEATCWKQRDQGPKETIEIGAIKLDSTGTIAGEYQTFVRPIVNPVLSEFCTTLTSITQQDVDQAPSFDQAIQDFKTWVGVAQENYILCSWGFYDRKQLRQDGDRFGQETSWTNRHISVKHQHHKLAATQRPLGMATALLKEGFELEGTHHRGIDDARNIAKVFLKYFGQWKLPKTV